MYTPNQSFNNPMMGNPGYNQNGPMGYPQNNMMGMQPGYGQQMQQGYAQPMATSQVGFLQNIPPEAFSGYSILERLPGLFIKQKPQYLEAMTGIEQENVYYVHGSDKQGDKDGFKLLKAKEKSGWCSRNCLPADIRPFKIKVEHELYPKNGQNFLSMDKEFRCACLCFNRPEMEVRHVENNSDERLGKIVQPFFCCNKGLSVHDKSDTHIYTVVASCCQLGFFCNAPCESCQTINFEIKNAGGETVGSLQKQSPGCAKQLLTDADNFSLIFPQNATVQEKSLLLSSVILMDFAYFESKQGPNQNNRNGMMGNGSTMIEMR
jgi:hypothetical protein